MTIPYESLASYDAVKRRNQFIVGNVPKMGMAELSLIEFSSLAIAKSTIGTTTKMTLTVAEPHTLSSNVDLSDTLITLKFVNDGDIDLNGHTLTVGAIETTGNRQIFKGSGTVRYANGSTNLINLAWRAGNANNADVTVALNEAIASLTYAGGICGIYVPQLSPVTSGGHICESGFHLFGNGNFTTGTNGRGNTLRIKSGATPDFMFKIGEGKACIRFADIVLDADGAAGVDGILVEGAEGSGTTVADVSLRHVTIDSFQYGFNHNSTSGAHQLAQTKFDTCIFQGCTSAGLRTNSVNEGITLINTNVAVPAGAIGWQNDGCGMVEWTGGEGAGGGSTTKFTVITAAHGAINFAPFQDENFSTFLQNDASDSSGIINFGSGCLIQSKIQLNQTCKVNLLPGCNIMSYAIQGTATGAVVTVHEGCNIRTKSVNDGTTNVIPAVLLGAGSAVKVVTENLTDLGVFKQRIPQEFIAPLSALGAPNTPVAGFAHITNGADEDKVLARFGRKTTAEVWDYYYDVFRKHSTGWLHFVGNQADPNKGFNFNAPVEAVGRAYDATTWNGSSRLVTEDSIRDKIETLSGGGGAASPLTLTAANASEIPLTLKQASSQTAKPFQITRSDNSDWFYVEPVAYGNGLKFAGYYGSIGVSLNERGMYFVETGTGGNLNIETNSGNAGPYFYTNKDRWRFDKAIQIISGGFELNEISAPGAPGANQLIIYAEDNGSGKTRLMVRFPSGAAQQISIEP